MQKIYFEKWIDLNHQLNELLSLSVDESINYKIESVGVRAVGSLIVKGEYNGNHKFDENIELDVLATFDKIVDQRDFNIKVEDFDYFIKDGNIQIKIEVGIHGVVEGEDRYGLPATQEKFNSNKSVGQALEEIENLIKDTEPANASIEQLVRAKPVEVQETGPVTPAYVAQAKQPESKPMAAETTTSTVKEIKAVAKEMDNHPKNLETSKVAVIPQKSESSVHAAKEPAVHMTKEPMAHVAKEAAVMEVSKKETAMAEEISEQLQEKVYQSKSRPIFQDTSDSVGTYYLYIVKENDSYSEVATRYSVDEEIIRNYNQDKALEAGSVLIIPYVP